MCKPFVWSHLGLNQGLPDYEVGGRRDFERNRMKLR